MRCTMPPAARPPLTMDPSRVDEARARSVVGDQLIIGPGRWRVGENGFGDGVVLLFAGQSWGDGNYQTGEAGRGGIRLIDQLFPQSNGRIFPPLFAVGFAPGRWCGGVIFRISGRNVCPAGDWAGWAQGVVVARGVPIDVGAHPIRVIDTVSGENAIDGRYVWSFSLVFGARRNVALAEELAHFLL